MYSDTLNRCAQRLNMVFQMHMVDLAFGSNFKYAVQEWHLQDLDAALGKWQRFIISNDGCTTIFLENHDQARSTSHFGSYNTMHRDMSGKMLAIFLCTLTGTLFVYQRQEIVGLMHLLVGQWKNTKTSNLSTTTLHQGKDERRSQFLAESDSEHWKGSQVPL